MNYAATYSALIERAKGRVLSGYVERHHIVPRCLGGSDDPANIVRLTPEEHYVAHQLLVKMHPGHIGLVWALSAMTNGTGKQPRANKRYGWVRRLFAETLRERYKGKPLTPEHRAKLSAAAKVRIRRPHSEAAKAKMRKAALLRKRSPEHCAALSRAKLGKSQGRRSDAARARMSAAQKVAIIDRSHMQTQEYREARSAQMKRVWADRRAATEA